MRAGFFSGAAVWSAISARTRARSRSCATFSLTAWNAGKRFLKAAPWSPISGRTRARSRSSVTFSSTALLASMLAPQVEISRATDASTFLREVDISARELTTDSRCIHDAGTMLTVASKLGRSPDAFARSFYFLNLCVYFLVLILKHVLLRSVA